ncbi:MAG: IMP cyclohydrolase [Deltaproteobacteria bacterium]|jgi:phosphoribosylaminoimidazolecarboxamide formyltransferase/IMP cyclohydrolase|nr:IMP cyclohydrolase [Deltaproteobacteria bacterium]
MSSLKGMYTRLLKDDFPAGLTLDMGGQKLVYKKRQWTLEDEVKGLRYGENPDQPAALYELVKGGLEFGGVAMRGPDEGIVSAISEAQMLQAGKHPGKTNLTDVDSGVNILQSLTQKPAAAILKHNNPCGAAWSEGGIGEALEKAFWCDRIAAFGGAVVVNTPLDKRAAEIIDSAYFEVVAAPDFEPGVLEVLKKRKNLRIFKLPALGDLSGLARRPFLEIKSLVDGGLIVQQSFMNRIRKVEDFIPASAAASDGSAVTAATPTPRELDDLLFAWAVESGVISNSIIFAKDGATVAIGAGEQDRVGCVELAIFKSCTKHADKLAFKRCGLSLYELRLKAAKDKEAAASLAEVEAATQAAKGGLKESVMVSDGFFPFRDGVDAALCHGIRAIAQPGGSLRDAEVIAAVNEQHAAMVFTGQRAFKH